MAAPWHGTILFLPGIGAERAQRPWENESGLFRFTASARTTTP